MCERIERGLRLSDRTLRLRPFLARQLALPIRCCRVTSTHACDRFVHEWTVARAHAGLWIALLTTVREALTQPGRFDVAFVDVWLPDGTVLDILPKWRRSRRLRSLPVRVISGESIDSVAAACLLHKAPAISKGAEDPLFDVAMDVVREVAETPRTAAEEKRRFAEAVADDAHLPAALRDVLVRRTLGETAAEIAASRGTCEGTVRVQIKQIAAVLRPIGIEVGDDLEKAMLRELVAERYDA